MVRYLKSLDKLQEEGILYPIKDSKCKSIEVKETEEEDRSPLAFKVVLADGKEFYSDSINTLENSAREYIKGLPEEGLNRLGFTTRRQEIEIPTIGARPINDKALKYDNGKVDWSLMPIEAMEEVIKVFEKGALKYARNNYRHGFNSNRLIASCLRHITTWQRGTDLDEETQLSHLSHAICCLLMLRTNEIDGVLEDGRYKRQGETKA